MRNICITSEGIKKLLQNLKPNKAAGPDGIRPKVLKELAPIIAPVLHVIFTRSLPTQTVSNDWKIAMITPVFKKGDKDSPTNYRPISLTCICSKLLEHIITSCMMSYLDEYKILHHLQHGFCQGRSCETQLLELTRTNLLSNLASGNQTDLIILDFSKAFDKVCHKKLLSKLDYYGIRGNTLLWINSFLSNRQQCVVVDGEKSSYLPVLSGVPQGSSIGPALFLLYRNDLPEYVESTVHLFADDTVLYLTINSQDSCLQLQTDLFNLEVWEQDWLMSFNPEKCEILRVYRKKTPFLFNYNLHGVPLKTVPNTKYPGVLLSHDLKWNTHISKMTAKGYRTLGFLKRKLRVNSPTLKAKAYASIPRHQLEYCSTVWDPRNIT